MRHLILVVTVIGLFTACGETNTDPYAGREIEDRVLGSGYYSGPEPTLREFMERNPVIVIGRVLSSTVSMEPLYPPDAFPTPDLSLPPPPGREHVTPALEPPKIPVTRHEVLIEWVPDDAIFSVGEVMAVSQGGGIYERSDGKLERWVGEDDGLLEDGQRYLLFTEEYSSKPSVYGAPPWGKILLTEGIPSLIAPFWATYPTMVELLAKTEEEIKAAINAESQ